MTRKEFIKNLQDAFYEMDEEKFILNLNMLPAYEEHAYECRKREERIEWAQNMCDCLAEDTEGLPETVFEEIANTVEERMLENNGDLEYDTVKEILKKYREREDKHE